MEEGQPEKKKTKRKRSKNRKRKWRMKEPISNISAYRRVVSSAGGKGYRRCPLL